MRTRTFCRKVKRELPDVWEAWVEAARNDKLLPAAGPVYDAHGRE